MDDAPNRREVLRLGLGGLGALLAGGTGTGVASGGAPSSSAPETGSPPPGAPSPPGRSHRDVAGRRRLLYSLMGDLPDRERTIAARTRSEEERASYVLETLELDLNGLEPVPAYYARPKGPAARRPAIVFNHSHGGGYTIGKKEVLEAPSYPPPRA